MIADEVLQFVNNRPFNFPYLDVLNSDYYGNGAPNRLEDKNLWEFLDTDIAWLPKSGLVSFYLKQEWRHFDNVHPH